MSLGSQYSTPRQALVPGRQGVQVFDGQLDRARFVEGVEGQGLAGRSRVSRTVTITACLPPGAGSSGRTWAPVEALSTTSSTRRPAAVRWARTWW
ncbi:hypothetical protein [Actinokineospora sp. NBRC 105648]|uniref:hypothetical protein n=1 Tax=Actinokineospora sp. NBRC 105648 TaxID=3032206 RepID=UPI002552B36E|nr:hypothetical protein [Actinokineospora sp. NBRC 105648]